MCELLMREVGNRNPTVVIDLEGKRAIWRGHVDDSYMSKHVFPLYLLQQCHMPHHTLCCI